MKLRSIEIKGFKSFYQRTKIEFPEGIVSIVGPNGSGKSNILDAFRWVLGEQSAKTLRGEKMEDVIFSGTARHNQSNSCEVEVVFENEDSALDIDFSEISIKRKAFRNGESGYYINGKQARLKEIRELFLDSGIGKEGYSIISQGKIDEIVNATSIQRRKLLEEASGIARFRFKKEESEKKIENSKVNLERLEDIYKEIERQIVPLEIQKEKALEYLRLSEDLKRSDISLMIREYDSIHLNYEKDEKTFQEILTKLDQVEAKIEANKDDIERFEENNKKIRESIQALESEKNRLDLQKNDLHNEVQRFQEIISLKRSQLDKIDLAKEKKQLHLEQLDLEKSKIEAEQEVFEKKHKEQSRKQEIIIAQTDSLSGKIKALDVKIDEVANDNKKMIESISKNELRIQFLTENIQREAIRKDESSNNIHRTRAKLDELFAQKKEQEDALDRLGADQDTLTKESDRLTKDRERIISDKEKVRKELDNKNQHLREIFLKHNMYSSMERDLEGINKSVKTILEQKGSNGIIDIVSNIISTDKKYERAIETALGSSLQHIITEDSLSAKKAIEYLKKNSAGRATFLPIDLIKGSRLNIADATLACDVVSFDGRFRSIIYQLLGRTLIVDDMDEALRKTRQYENKYRIVTLEGEIFNVGGSITGGHYYKSNNFLSRKRSIREYKNQMDSLQKEVDSLKARMESFKLEEFQITGKISENRKKTEENQKMIQSSKLTFGDIKNRINYLNNTLENLLGENKGSEEQQLENHKMISELKQTQKDLEETMVENRYILEDLQSERKILMDDLAKKTEDKNQITIESIRLDNCLENHKKDIQRLFLQIKDLQEQMEDDKQEIRNINEEISVSEQKIAETMMNLQLSEVEYDETLMEFEGIQEQLKKDSKKFESVSILKDQMEQEKLQLMEQKFKIEGKLDKVNLVSEKIIERLMDDYQLTLPEAKTLELDDSASKDSVSQLRKKINDLGNVNIDAINDHEVLFERYETYRVQISDLTDSISELENIITSLEKDMARDFTSSFQNISKTFGTVFSKMFGGGEGKLELSNNSDVLNSEIEIYAQPPGKKLKSISVMSGGEKALMGIALLFSIQMTKPAPFCILDEIDAALDDANISRFNVFLKQMSDNIQFVTITHRRGTMENSDYIYGVTMQDKGVSKLVSLKFEDAQEYIEQ